MKKFFIKHKVKILLIAAIIVAACSITAVSIALWNSDNEEEIIYNIPTNPSEKYLEYYAVVKNSSSENGYDYYPVTRVPNGLDVLGLAVARYSGFAMEVEIPERKQLTINGIDDDWEVIHVLNRYSDTLGNGFTGTGSPNSIIVPETITYIASGAFDEDDKVTVLGGTKYEYSLTLSTNSFDVLDDSSNVIDKLVKQNDYYLSLLTYDIYPIDNDSILYSCYYPSIVVLDQSYNTPNVILAKRIKVLGNYDISYQDSVSRVNNLTYTLSNPDLFGSVSGYMNSIGGDSYEKYIISTTNSVFTFNGDSVNLSKGKYLITYDGVNNELEEPVLISYSVDSLDMELDLSFTDYERYYLDTTLSGNDISVSDGNSVIATLSNSLSGNYRIYYSPDTLFSCDGEITNIAIEENYYLHKAVINNDVNDKVGFILPQIDNCIYVANINGNSHTLINTNNTLYYTEVLSDGSCFIEGYVDNVLVYKSHTFDYVLGNKYDLTVETTLINQTNQLENNMSSFDIVLSNSISGINSVGVNISASYIDVHGGYTANTQTLEPINVLLEDNRGSLTSDMISNPILANAAILSTEYIFTSYVITLNVGGSSIVVYNYSNSNTSASIDLDFYQKEYFISYKEASSSFDSYYKFILVGRLNKNFGNNIQDEYIYQVNGDGFYVVSRLDSINQIDINDKYISALTNEYVSLADGNISSKSTLEYGLSHVGDLSNINGTYLIYNGEYVRLAGHKQYYISVNGTNFKEMDLVSGNLVFEEYQVTNYSVTNASNTITVKDDLNNVYTHTLESPLSVGLYSSISFSLDNHRRKENNYEVLTNVKVGEQTNSVSITLDGVTYYIDSNDLTLPNYSDVFTLADGLIFEGWLDNSGNAVSVAVENGVYTSKLAMSVGGNGYTVVSGGAIVNKLYLGDTFVLNPNKGYSDTFVVMIDSITLEAISGVYTVNNLGLFEVEINPDTFTISIEDSVDTYEYIYGSMFNIPLPAEDENFLYYYDKTTGVVYTDNTGRLVSPYILTKDVTLTPAYQDEFFVIVNKYLDGVYQGSVILNQDGYSAGMIVNDYLPVYHVESTNYHYSSISAYVTSTGAAVSFEINEFLHQFSFAMPNGNVIINIDYSENGILASEVNKTVGSPLYVLVPVNFAKDVKIYDAINGNYVSMTRLSSDEQIYPGYIAYRSDDFYSKTKILANGYESYPYEVNSNLLIIENFSLENELCHQTKWISYTYYQASNEAPIENNIFVFDANEYDLDNYDIVPIEGMIKVDEEANTITILKATNVLSDTMYQKASFEIIDKTTDIPVSFVISYKSLGTESSPILIYNYEDFEHYMTNSRYCYISGLYFKQTADFNVEDGNGYDSVFSSQRKFNHNYDGNNFTVVYEQIDIRDDYSNGLFAYIGPEGSVSNLKIDYSLLNPNNIGGFDTKSYVGAVASVNEGIIKNVETLIGGVECNNVSYFGGLVGINAGHIDSCINRFSIIAYEYGVKYSNFIGGIAGFNNVIGLIENCYNYAEIDCITSTGKTVYWGDITAMSVGNYGDNIINNNSVATSMDEIYIGQANPNLGKKYVYYFTNNYTWDNVYAYAWKGNTLNAAWPGVQIHFASNEGDSYYGQNDLGQHVYYFATDDQYEYIIFNNNNGEQTENISLKNSNHANWYLSKNNSNTWTVGKVSTSSDYQVLLNGESVGSTYKTIAGGIDNQEVVAYSVKCNVGDTIEARQNANNPWVGFKLNLGSGSEGAFVRVDGKLVCKIAGTYDIYVKLTTDGIKSTTHTKYTALKTISLTFADDWWFIKETKVYNGQNYYIESGIKVETFNSSGVSKGYIVYGYDEIYEYKGMKSIKAQMLAGASGGYIEVSRVMLINNYDGGNDQFYFGFDSVNGFYTIGEQMTSYPDDTYKVRISYNLANSNNQFFIYTTNSNTAYATTENQYNSAKVTTEDRNVVGYIDVLGLEKYESFRVLYYQVANLADNSTVRAVRSYKPGEQVELLEDITIMRFEVVIEGIGPKCIGVISNAADLLEKTSITFTASEIESSYALLLNDESLINLYQNEANASLEYFVKEVYFEEGQTFKIVEVNGNTYTDVADFNNDFYSSDKISFNFDTNVYSILRSTTLDVYYKVLANEAYVGDASYYDVYFYDASNYYSIRLHTDPDDGQVLIATNITFNKNSTASIRKAGEDTNQTITLTNNPNNFAISNSVITFSGSDAVVFDIVFDSHTKEVSLVRSRTGSHEITLGSEGNTSYESNNMITNGNGKIINFEANGYGVGNIYYVDGNDNIIGFYPFDGKTNYIPCVDNATKLYIVKQVLIGETYTQMYNVVVNAIYPGKTLTITNPYYGYYDARYSSSSEDIVALYFKSNSQTAYFNYELNDGRTGTIAMRNLDGYHSISFETIIGLNPVNVWFSRDGLTTNKLDLSDINIALYNCYDESLTLLNYENSQPIYIYIDEDCPLWDVYYILIDGIYYPVSEVDDRLYAAYVNINDGKAFQITSNHTLDNVIMSYELSYNRLAHVYKIYGIGTTHGDMILNYASVDEAINATIQSDLVYDYYLTGSFETDEDNNYGFSLYDGLYYAFIEVSEATVGYVDSFSIDLVKGYNVVVYDKINAPTSYNNELTYDVSFIYGNNVYRKSYLIGDLLELPDFTPMIGDSHKYSFTFDGWYYDGVKLTSGIPVVNDMDIYAKFTSTPKQFIVTLKYGDEIIETFEVNFGQRVSNINEPSFLNPEKPVVGNAWFAGWFFDKAFDLNSENYIITKDTTLYARWYLEGVFLFGRVDGFTDWNDQRSQYHFASGNDQDSLEDIYLQEGDLVRIYHYFAENNNSYSIKYYPTLDGGTINERKNMYYLEGTVYSSTDKTIFDVDDSLNIVIKKSGYYDFYMLWKGYGVDTDNEVHITYREYIVNYDANGGVIDIDSKRFNMDDEYQLVNSIDDNNNPNAPTGTKGNGYVLYGLFTLPEGGDRVTTLLPSMMNSKNSITLYAQYIYGGYYLGGSSETDLITTTPKTIRLEAGESIDINYYKGSVNGSSSLETVLGSNNVVINGNTITATLAANYKIYVDGSGKLVIDQYHNITYILGPVSTYNSTSSMVEVNDCLYGSDLLTEEQLNILIPESYFVSWIINPDTNPSVETIVTGDLVYYALYETYAPENPAKDPVTVVIKDYADTNGWENGVQYTTLVIDEYTSITAGGTANSGKYYTTGTNWRFYQSANSTITISSSKVIASVTITYLVEANGVLCYENIQIESGLAFDINARKITFALGNTTAATNGQVRITEISVTYK